MIDVAECLRKHLDFEAGALSAKHYATMHDYVIDGRMGELHHFDLADFLNDMPFIDYIVFSGDTPIAWHTRNGKDHRIGQSVDMEHQELISLHF